jgi:cytidine deaminase
MVQIQSRDLTKSDCQLLEAARKLFERRYQPGRHHVAAALRTESGDIVTGMNLEASVGPTDVCAEVVAIGRAATEGFEDIESIVAVAEDDIILAPCGNCRQLISDFSTNPTVIVPGDEGQPVATKLDELLPCAVGR